MTSVETWFRRLVRVPLAGGLILGLAVRLAGPYKRRRKVASAAGRAVIAPGATVRCADLRLGPGAYVDDGCLIFSHDAASGVEVGEGASVLRGTIIETGSGGSVHIGAGTHIQAGCILAGFGRLHIGCNVQVAPRCAFYPYSHVFDDPARTIAEQPLRSRGGIDIEDDVWLGVGVIVLDGVRVGRGAVVGAGAVVTRDVPALSIAAGNPARVIGRRGGPRNAET